MTQLERNLPNSNFSNAGRLAFLLNVPFLNNPYKNNPYRVLWETGYRAAKRKFDQTRKAEVLIGGKRYK